MLSRPNPPIRRFVAVGDSFTEGLQDGPGTDGHFAGWADRVATALAAGEDTLSYANLAVRGRLLDEIVAEQVPAALALDPDVVSFHGGGNDVLRPGVEIADIARRYEDAVARLATEVPTLLLFTIVERSGPSGRLADRLAGRIGALNAAIRRVATTHRATLIDTADLAPLQDRRLWHEDRLHLNPEGHARVAAAVLDALRVPDVTTDQPADWWRAPLPPLPTPSLLRRRQDDLRWATRHLAPWVVRRLRGTSSGDGIVAKRPELVDVVTSAITSTVQPERDAG